MKGDDATAVIELKGTNTTDLDKIETQAFGYKNHHPKCIYVITSNFGKLRFYIQNAVDHIDFDLFNLTKEQFSLLWLCLAKDNLLADLPLKIKESSVLQEENITKKLYADYSRFRTAIYNNLIKNNHDTDKLLLFKKTQKLLGGAIVFSDITTNILEKNIFGVDLNEESVEIAKLSLWLRTAQKGRKLNTLSNNIKCGNSLIDDPEIAGEKAFNWQKEFPNVFRKKEKKAWHVTWVTHDIRTSARMIKYKVRERRANGEMHVDRSVILNNNEAIKVTEIIASIITDENLIAWHTILAPTMFTWCWFATKLNYKIL